MKNPIEAVLFDLDGVLVHSPLDLAAIKQELFGDEAVYIIEGLNALPDKERERKSAVLLERELEAAGEAVIAPGVNGLFAWLESHGMKRGVITRNARAVVELIMEKSEVDFGVIIAREDAPPKPDPASVRKALGILGVEPEASVMVGDFTFDIQAGKSAGCWTVFLQTEKFRHLETGADAVVGSLEELQMLLEKWINS